MNIVQLEHVSNRLEVMLLEVCKNAEEEFGKYHPLHTEVAAHVGRLFSPQVTVYGMDIGCRVSPIEVKVADKLAPFIFNLDHSEVALKAWDALEICYEVAKKFQKYLDQNLFHEHEYKINKPDSYVIKGFSLDYMAKLHVYLTKHGYAPMGELIKSLDTEETHTDSHTSYSNSVHTSKVGFFSNTTTPRLESSRTIGTSKTTCSYRYERAYILQQSV